MIEGVNPEGCCKYNNIVMRFLSFLFYFYRASYASTVLAVIVCPSVRLSVCHKSELYKDG